MKRVIQNFSAIYENPVSEIMTVDNEDVLCVSSELDDLRKEDFDFEWEN